MKNDHRSKFSNLSNWKEEAWKKNRGFNRIRTRDLHVTSALLYQLSYEATHWEQRQIFDFISPMRSEMIWSILYEIIHININFDEKDLFFFSVHGAEVGNATHSPQHGSKFYFPLLQYPKASTRCKKTWSAVPCLGLNGLSMVLCLWSLLIPLSKLLAIQAHAQNMKEQLWMERRELVSVIPQRSVTSSDLQQERLVFCQSVSTFLQLVVACWKIHINRY